MGFPDARCHTARVFSRPFVITRTTVNFWLDVATLLVMLALTATGGIMFFVLPPVTRTSSWDLADMTSGSSISTWRSRLSSCLEYMWPSIGTGSPAS